MATINVKTKFDVGDSVFGFVDGEIHNLIIDRIDIEVQKLGCRDNPFQRNRIVYLATTTDAKLNIQHRISTETLLHTKDELKEYVNKYFEDYGLQKKTRSL